MGKITFETLPDLVELGRGSLDVMVRDAIRQVRDDMVDRPSLKKARIIQIDVNLLPIADQKGKELDSVEVAATVKVKLPVSSTPPTIMTVDAQQTLFFQDFSRDNPHQNDLPLKSGGKNK